MKNAFDSVSRPLIILWWQRLGVPRALAGWLLALDFHDHAIVRTDYALGTLNQEGLSLRSLLNVGRVRLTFTVLLLGLRFLMSCLHSWIMNLTLRIISTSVRLMIQLIERDVCYADNLHSVAQALDGRPMCGRFSLRPCT